MTIKIMSSKNNLTKQSGWHNQQQTEGLLNLTTQALLGHNMEIPIWWKKSVKVDYLNRTPAAKVVLQSPLGSASSKSRNVGEARKSLPQGYQLCLDRTGNLKKV